MKMGIVTLLVASFVPLTAQAQSVTARREPRLVRITAAPRYELPGVITIEAKSSQGRPVNRMGNFVQFSLVDGGPPVTIPVPGSRVEGYAISLGAAGLTFEAAGPVGRITLPLNSIARIEMGSARASRAVATTAAIATGTIAWYVLSKAFLARCGDEGGCGGSGGYILATVGGGLALATIVSRTARGLKWRPVSVIELETELR